MVTELVWLFVRVTVWVGLVVFTVTEPKFSEDAAVPVRCDNCGVLGALSATETYAEKGVVTAFTVELPEVGVKVTEMVQCACGASVVPQVLALMANWLRSVPVRVTEEIVSGMTPVLLRVRVLAALVTPTCCWPKLS